LSHARDDGKGTDWYKNLKANPECQFDIDGQIYDCKAVSLEPDKKTEQKTKQPHPPESSSYKM